MGSLQDIFKFSPLSYSLSKLKKIRKLQEGRRLMLTWIDCLIVTSD